MNLPHPTLVSATPRSLCYAIEGIAKLHIRAPWTSRPYNFRDPDKTTWWLVPSAEWPAYKFGKFGFWIDEAEPGVILAGYQVEKGVGASVASVFNSAAGKRFVIQPDWEWNRFVEDGLSGEDVDVALNAAAADLGTDVYVHLACGIANDPKSFDPGSPAFPKTSRLFVWSPEVQALQLVRAAGASHVAPATAGATSINELLVALNRVEDRDWLWVSLSLCARLQPTAGGHPSNHNDLWTKGLGHFKQWVNP